VKVSHFHYLNPMLCSSKKPFS